MMYECGRRMRRFLFETDTIAVRKCPSTGPGSLKLRTPSLSHRWVSTFSELIIEDRFLECGEIEPVTLNIHDLNN